MGERNQIEDATFVADLERATDNFIEFFEGEKLGDGEFTYGNDQIWLEKVDLIVHPGGAIPDLVRRRDSVATCAIYPGKTAADGRKINRSAHLFLGHSAKLPEPSKKGAARSPGEGFSKHRLFYARRLADEHDFAEDGATGNGRWQH